MKRIKKKQHVEKQDRWYFMSNRKEQKQYMVKMSKRSLKNKLKKSKKNRRAFETFS